MSMSLKVLKLLSVISVALLMSACSSTKAGKGSASGSLDPEEQYRIASEKLEPFTAIPGSKTNAKASDRVFFGYDSSALSETAKKTLERQAGWLKKHADVKVTVEGHCDERGTREYNIALGARRASAAKSQLVKLGVPAARISTVSYGKERPAVVGSDAAAWAENRRAVTVLIDKK
jgi:peptidoglycan-associated lipoprotein